MGMSSISLSAKVYGDIKNMLMTLIFPPGSYLREQTVADMLCVSRTPVREAIQRLAHEGWLVIGDGKRVHVRSVTSSDVNELFQLRFLLEPYAAREVFAKTKERTLAGRLDEVVNEQKKMINDNFTFVQFDMKFHSLIMEYTENMRLVRFWKTLHEESSRAAVMTLEDNDRRSLCVIEEHLRMVNAFWSKDLNTVINVINKHLEQSRDALIYKLDNLKNAHETDVDDSNIA
jgi:DNA-binding GntR family transcriptional regulator